MSASRLAFGGALALSLAGCLIKGNDLLLPPSIATSQAVVETAARLGGSVVEVDVSIVNGTDGSLEDLTALIEYLVPPPTPWLSVSFDRSTATRTEAATLRIRIDPADIALGENRATILLNAAEATNGPFHLPLRVQIGPRPPAKIVFVTQPAAQAVNGQPLAPQPLLQLLNALDQPALEAGVVVDATVAGSGGQLLGTGRAPSDDAGRVTFTDLAILGLVGSKQLVFSSSGLTPATSNPIALSAGAAARMEAASLVTQVANAGTAVTAPPRILVTDVSANPVAGSAIGFAASAGSVILPAGPLLSDANGIAALTQWTLRPTPGANTVVATSAAGLTGSPVTFTATGQVGPAFALLKQSGDNLVGIVSTTLGTPHVVKVADAFGNGVTGIAVGWAATGGGTVNPAAPATDADGLAAASRTLGPTVGPQGTTATATIGGGPVAVSFAITAAAAGPAIITKVAGDNQTAPAGTTLADALQVLVSDAVNSPLANVTVNWTASLGGSFPSGATSQTNAAGLAMATWRLGTTAGTQTAQAAVGGPAPAFFSATATAGAVNGTASTIAASPASISAGGTSTITVTALDVNGNPVSGVNVVLTVVGGGAATQPAGPTSASGQASGSFSSTVTGLRTVSATAGGVALTQTATINVTPGPATTIIATTTTSLTPGFGQNVSPAPSVHVSDAFANAVSGYPVTFSASPSGGSVLGQSNPNTDPFGNATVGTWFVNPVNTALSSVTNPFNVVFATAAGLGGSPIQFQARVIVSFANNVQPILSAHCTSCHFAGGQSPDLSPGSSYNALVVPGIYVQPGDSLTITTTPSIKNYLICVMSSRPPDCPAVTMPPSGLLPPNLVSIIKAWIQQGAPNN